MWSTSPPMVAVRPVANSTAHASGCSMNHWCQRWCSMDVSSSRLSKLRASRVTGSDPEMIGAPILDGALDVGAGFELAAQSAGGELAYLIVGREAEPNELLRCQLIDPRPEIGW